MTTLEWKNPWPRTRQARMTNDTQRTLRKWPDRWASVGYSKSTANATMWKRNYGKRGFEFRTRVAEEDERPSPELQYELFARYSPRNAYQYDPEEDYDRTGNE